ncbi:peptidylprolyl isomerase [bacterium]|nr:peptidylprolyl isomerase [bacterium]
MMQQMRQSMKVILWILVLAFIATIVFSWGMGGFEGSGPKQGVVANINGQEISLDLFEETFQQRYQYEQSQQEEDLNEYQARNIRTQIWDEMVRDILVQQEVKKLGIKVSDKEIAYLVQNSPPVWIQQAEVFQTDSLFDMAKYQDFLRNPAAARDLMMIEENYRQSLPSQKFLNYILALVTVTDQETWQKYVDDNLKAKAKFVTFRTDAVEVDSSIVTDKMISDYYFAHREEYLEPEKRRIAYVLFSEEPSAKDSAAVYELAEELMQRLKEGDDFAKLALEFSDDRSGENGGELGWFERGRMVPEFEEVAFASKKGDVVGPIQSKFGYHIIKVTGKKTEDGMEKVEASHILLKVEPSMDTKDELRNAVAGLTDEIQNKTSFHDAAEIFGVNVDTTAYFEKSDYIPGLGRLPAAVDYVFKRPLGDVGPTYTVREGMIIFKILDMKKERTKTVDEVRDTIVQALLEQHKLGTAKANAAEFFSQLPDAAAFETLAEERKLTVEETENPFAFAQYIRGIGRDYEFNTAALNLEVGEVGGPVKGQYGYYVMKVTEKTSVDSTKYLAKKDEIRSQILNQKQNEYFTQWLVSATEKANIKDFRYLYYRDY